MEEAKKKLTPSERKLRQKLKNFDLDIVTEDLLVTNKYHEKLDELENMKDELIFAIEDFLTDYNGQFNEAEAKCWTDKIDYLQSSVKKHRIEIQNKAAEARKLVNPIAATTSHVTVPLPSNVNVVS